MKTIAVVGFAVAISVSAGCGKAAALLGKGAVHEGDNAAAMATRSIDETAPPPPSLSDDAYGPSTGDDTASESKAGNLAIDLGKSALEEIPQNALEGLTTRDDDEDR